MPDPIPNVQLSVSVADAQKILNHLARGVFADVADLICDIKGQTETQLRIAQVKPAGDSSCVDSARVIAAPSA